MRSGGRRQDAGVEWDRAGRRRRRWRAAGEHGRSEPVRAMTLAKTPPLDRSLRIAVDAARALAEFHEASGVHGALTPAWLNGAPPQQRRLELWGYRAPEQTGGLPRPVDERGGLYALG